MKNDHDFLTLGEAIDWVMQRTGKSRRDARAALFEACRQGKIPATGIRLDTGERETIPPECFPKVN